MSETPETIIRSGLEMREAHYPSRAPIDAYGSMGFRFAEMEHDGSLLCLPSGIYGWAATTPSELNLDDLSRVLGEASAVEIMLFGMGADLYPLKKDIKAVLREHNIVAEVMNSGAAVRTYNVLLAEDRAVGAALFKS